MLQFGGHKFGVCWDGRKCKLLLRAQEFHFGLRLTLFVSSLLFCAAIILPVTLFVWLAWNSFLPAFLCPDLPSFAQLWGTVFFACISIGLHFKRSTDFISLFLVINFIYRIISIYLNGYSYFLPYLFEWNKKKKVVISYIYKYNKTQFKNIWLFFLMYLLYWIE